MRVDGAHVAEFTSLRPLLFSVAYRLLGRASDAEDMVQEVWLRYAPCANEVRDQRPGAALPRRPAGEGGARAAVGR